jgi:hypothetical protein
LFIFEAAWVALGVALLSPERLHARRSERPRRASLD